MSNVLIIEDDRIFADDLVFFVELLGHQCTYISNADDVMDNIQSIPSYDHILLDLMMYKGASLPEDSGDRSTGEILFEKIRDISPHVKIIIITAKNRSEIDQSILIDKNTEVIVKPVMEVKKMLEDKIS